MSFSSAGSNDPDGTITSYARGRSATAEQAPARRPRTPTTTAGTFTATLKVTDNAGATATKSLTITASAPARRAPTEPHGHCRREPVGDAALDDASSNETGVFSIERAVKAEEPFTAVGDCRRERHDVLSDRHGWPVGVSRARVQRERQLGVLESDDVEGAMRIGRAEARPYGRSGRDRNRVTASISRTTRRFA